MALEIPLALVQSTNFRYPPKLEAGPDGRLTRMYGINLPEGISNLLHIFHRRDSEDAHELSESPSPTSSTSRSLTNEESPTFNQVRLMKILNSPFVTIPLGTEHVHQPRPSASRHPRFSDHAAGPTLVFYIMRRPNPHDFILTPLVFLTLPAIPTLISNAPRLLGPLEANDVRVHLERAKHEHLRLTRHGYSHAIAGQSAKRRVGFRRAHRDDTDSRINASSAPF